MQNGQHSTEGASKLAEADLESEWLALFELGLDFKLSMGVCPFAPSIESGRFLREAAACTLRRRSLGIHEALLEGTDARGAGPGATHASRGRLSVRAESAEAMGRTAQGVRGVTFSSVGSYHGCRHH